MGTGKGTTNRIRVASKTFTQPQWTEVKQGEWATLDQEFRISWDIDGKTWYITHKNQCVANRDFLPDAKRWVADLYKKEKLRGSRLVKIHSGRWETRDGRFIIRRGGDLLYAVDEDEPGVTHEMTLVDEFEKAVQFIKDQYAREDKNKQPQRKPGVHVDVDELIF